MIATKGNAYINPDKVIQSKKINYLREMQELHKAVEHLKEWKQMQNTKSDKQTNFIYKAKTFDKLMEMYEQAKLVNPNIDKTYVINRWVNHVCSDITEKIFCSYNIVQKEKNKYHHTIDLYIMGIPFDLKLSVFPKALQKEGKKPEDYKGRTERNELIKWMYEHQSKQSRCHTKNRLFAVVYSDEKVDHDYILKSRFDIISQYVKAYLEYVHKKHQINPEFAFNKLQVDVTQDNKKETHTVLSDLLLIKI